MSLSREDLPGSLRGMEQRPLTGDALINFRQAIIDFDAKTKADYDREIANPSWIIDDEEEDALTIHKGFKTAVNHALSRTYNELMTKCPRSINYKTFVADRPLILTEAEKHLIQDSYADNRIKNQSYHPTLAQEICDEVNVILTDTDQIFANHFHKQLATQYGKLNDYLFEQLLAAFVIFIKLGQQMERNFAANGLADIETKIKCDASLVESAATYLKKHDAYKSEISIHNLYESIGARVYLICLKACMLGGSAKIETSFVQTLLGAEFMNCTIEAYNEKTDKRKEINYDFDPRKFVDSVEQSFLRKLSSAQKVDYKRGLNAAINSAQKQTGLEAPAEYLATNR